ncbi:MAG: hypothetical protein ACK4UY_16935, partial [Dietzia sp.]
IVLVTARSFARDRNPNCDKVEDRQAELQDAIAEVVRAAAQRKVDLCNRCGVPSGDNSASPFSVHRRLVDAAYMQAGLPAFDWPESGKQVLINRPHSDNSSKPPGDRPKNKHPGGKKGKPQNNSQPRQRLADDKHQQAERTSKRWREDQGEADSDELRVYKRSRKPRTP